MVNRLASDFVEMVLCGEGADELFAGYDFLGALPPEKLAAELDRLREELPDGGMQRVDRLAHAHGLEPRMECGPYGAVPRCPRRTG